MLTKILRLKEVHQRLVINYKPLNKALKWIRYPIPNKKEILQKLHSAFIFSKFDMKSRFWQIQIHPKDQYKIAFTVLFGQCIFKILHCIHWWYSYLFEFYRTTFYTFTNILLCHKEKWFSYFKNKNFFISNLCSFSGSLYLPRNYHTYRDILYFC